MKINLYQRYSELSGIEISVDLALQRVQDGSVKDEIEAIRNCSTKDEQQELKKELSAVTFSGTFKTRKDTEIIQHSGLMSLDFDKGELPKIKEMLLNWEYTYAFWISPSGKGYKALVKIENGSKHREHFNALENEFKKLGFEIDKACKNESRLCFESYDPNIYLNKNSKVYTKFAIQEFKTRIVTITEKEKQTDEYKIFENLKTWSSNKGELFVEGNRNNFILKMASACCRFGISEQLCVTFIRNDFISGDKSFSDTELIRTVKSGYNQNQAEFGTQIFENDKVINRITKVDESLTVFDSEEETKDIVQANDRIDEIKKLYEEGYTGAETTHIPDLDVYWKWVRGESNLLTGMGNCGKSTFEYELCLIKSLLSGTKWAVFGPEIYPSEQFFWELIEKLMGQDCTPKAVHRPSYELIEKARDFVHNHFFYIDPTEAPTIEYVKKKFIELVIKHGVDGCIIDPWNQLEHDYIKSGGRTDKYLETSLPEITKFASQMNVFLSIITHPRALIMPKNATDYKCPEVFDINDGAMWNNKMYNIRALHRPYGQSDPGNPSVELHTKKIKVAQRTGMKGVYKFSYHFRQRRFMYPFMNDDMAKHPLNTFLNGIVGVSKIEPNKGFETEGLPVIKHAPVKNHYEVENEEDNDFFALPSQTDIDAPF